MSNPAALDFVAWTTNSFRMPAFFIVAGFFAGLMLSRKEPAAWLANRFLRLGVPLLAGVILLNPFQMLVESVAAARGDMTWSVVSALWIEQLAQPGFHWLRHLWFLVALLWLCAAAAGATMLWPRFAAWRLSRRIGEIAERHQFLAYVPILAAVVVFCVFFRIAFYVLQANQNPIVIMTQITRAIDSLPFFVFGFLLSRSDGLLATVNRPNPLLWAGGIFAASAYASLMVLGLRGPGIDIVRVALSCVSGVLFLHILVSAAHARFAMPSATVRRLVDASFVIYLFHQPVILVVKLALLRSGADPLMASLVTMPVTLGLAYLIYLGIVRAPILNLLFNGISLPRRQAEKGSMQTAVAERERS